MYCGKWQQISNLYTLLAYMAGCIEDIMEGILLNLNYIEAWMKWLLFCWQHFHNYCYMKSVLISWHGHLLTLLAFCLGSSPHKGPVIQSFDNFLLILTWTNFGINCQVANELTLMFHLHCVNEWNISIMCIICCDMQIKHIFKYIYTCLRSIKFYQHLQ